MEKLVKAEIVAKHTDECGKAIRFKLSEIEEAMRGEQNAKKDGTRCRSNPAN